MNEEDLREVANMAGVITRRITEEFTRDLYWCEHCGITRRITEGFTRDPDKPATFYTGKVLAKCPACKEYTQFIKIL